jgi:hypothetical protein
MPANGKWDLTWSVKGLLCQQLIELFESHFVAFSEFPVTAY